MPRQHDKTPSSPPLRSDSLAYAILESAQLIDAVMSGRNLTEAFEQARELANPSWSDSTRGAIRDLTWRTLREFGRGDWVLSRLLSKPLPQLLHAMLLVALQRLESRPEQAHTIVDQTVLAARSIAPGLTGVINGVLRNSIRQNAVFQQEMLANPVCRHRHPEWWIARIRNSFPERWQETLEQTNCPPPMSVRVNVRRNTVEQGLARLEAATMAATRLSHDALLLSRPVAVHDLPGFSEGMLSVQDAGAQWAARWLAPQQGERVLDACAAPGGKTAHLLELADIDLLALELDPTRVDRIRHNLDRLGLQARVIQADASRPDQWWDGKPFDAILADVPCSASGVARRHPDIKWLRRNDDIPRFAREQRRIIDALWKTLASGGRMLYVTCSLFDEENEDQIRQFLSRHADARRVPLNGDPHQQLLPGNEHDGFFYALLRKN